jgi:hypothetical protein
MQGVAGRRRAGGLQKDAKITKKTEDGRLILFYTKGTKVTKRLKTEDGLLM